MGATESESNVYEALASWYCDEGNYSSAAVAALKSGRQHVVLPVNYKLLLHVEQAL